MSKVKFATRVVEMGSPQESEALADDWMPFGFTSAVVPGAPGLTAKQTLLVRFFVGLRKIVDDVAVVEPPKDVDVLSSDG